MGGPAVPVPVAIALGSNLGDRASHLAFAVGRLGTLLAGMRVSTWHDTAPVGVGAQPRFLNGAVAGTTVATPRRLLESLQALEHARGRTRPYAGAARTLDLDVILYGGWQLDEPGLQIPHPRFRDRLFVLAPLAEIAGEWVDPETGLTVAQLLARRTAMDDARRG